MKVILVKISPGELLDRISILFLKAEAASGSPLGVMIAEELADLTARWQAAFGEPPVRAHEWPRMLDVNRNLWALEDDVRAHEKAGDFNVVFIDKARAIYRTNDARASLKRQINERLRSPLHEHKLHRAVSAPAETSDA